MTYFDQTLECAPREQIESRQVVFFVVDGKVGKQEPLLHGKIEPSRTFVWRYPIFGRSPKSPFTTKSELMEAQEQSPPFGTNLTFPESAYTRFHQTSGTTGVPLRVLDTEESWKWWGHCWGFVMAAAGLTAEDRLFVPFSFGPFIGFWAAVEGSREVSAMMIPGGGRDSCSGCS